MKCQDGSVFCLSSEKEWREEKRGLQKNPMKGNNSKFYLDLSY